MRAAPSSLRVDSFQCDAAFDLAGQDAQIIGKPCKQLALLRIIRCVADRFACGRVRADLLQALSCMSVMASLCSRLCRPIDRRIFELAAIHFRTQQVRVDAHIVADEAASAAAGTVCHDLPPDTFPQRQQALVIRS